MSDHDGWAQPSQLLPNGLLPNEDEAPVIRIIDSDRWLKAEERTAQLIARIQPNQPSEERRNAVAYYVQHLIMKCFPCQVFTFGSVPLKTYLPDGDIDLTAFSNNQSLKETWANQVRDMLENEEKNEKAEFQVKEVQYIQAEVKIIKCLVGNIVVDISFNQLGGLCTLCFLEEVDHLINQNHLFKCSIILIKAWCYYESRILGAHYGLISTYALETLVLYIFHVFNNSFAGPLEVLYRFLEFFSNFDWDNFCLSLWGPVPISSLPDVTAEPPRKDSGELLLSKLFLDSCSSVYAVLPGGHDNQGRQPFISKHFNVIDPLRVNNNLGRSVSKGNFFRIRSAFTFGAKRLAQLLDCPRESIIFEVNQFFLNTWERHGIGHRPDAPEAEFSHMPLLNLENHLVSKNVRSNLSSRKLNQEFPGHETELEDSQYGKIRIESTSRRVGVSASSHAQSKSIYGNMNNSRNYSKTIQESKIPTNSQPEKPLNGLQGRYMFARTRSSPELANIYAEVSSRARHNLTMESKKNQGFSARKCEEQGMMNQEENDFVNMSASSGDTHGLNGHIHMPFPLSVAPMGFAHRPNIPLVDHSWASNLQLPHGLIPSSVSHLFPRVGTILNPEDSMESVNHDSWHEQDGSSPKGFDPDNGNLGSNNNQFEDSLQCEEERENGIYFNDQDANFRARVTMSNSSSTSTMEKGGRRTPPSIAPSVYGKSSVSDHGSVHADGENKDWNSFDLSESSSGDRSVTSLHVQRHEISGFESTNGSESLIPISQVYLGPGKRPSENSNVVPFTFYPTGPPVPFLTMLPVYNLKRDEEGDESGPRQIGDASEGIGANSMNSCNSFEQFEECKSDILNGDFGSHWQNLQFGRFCQNPGVNRHFVYSSSPAAAVPPIYQMPFDGHGRSVAANMNLLTHFMGYDSCVAQFSSMQSIPSRSSLYQCYADDNIPKFRSGTGTYLPNPKVSVRDQQHSLNSARRANYNSDRREQHYSDREGSWISNPKSRHFSRIGQHERQNNNNPRMDRFGGSESSRYDRPWGTFHSYPSQNGPLMNSNGPSYHNRRAHHPSAEHLEFGSVGPVTLNEAPSLDDGNHHGRIRVPEKQRFRR